MTKYEFITFFTDEVPNIEILGGKGANIAELVKLSYNIPPGFIINTLAYNYFIEQSPHYHQIIKMLKKLYSPKDVINYSKRLEGFIQETDFPSNLKNEIKLACESIKSKSNDSCSYAVRSSATIEDAKHISFAGQLESFLYNKSLDDIFLSIKDCWKSLFSPQTLLYFLKLNNNAKKESILDVQVAVIVQEMIESDIGGVLFTGNVLNNNLNQMVINSTWGSCETITGNRINPDMIIIDKKHFKVLEKYIGKKEKISVPNPRGTGTLLIQTQHSMKNKCSLSENQIYRLYLIGLDLEKNFNHPQDIEWAIKDDQIYILQSRPITSLKLNLGM